MIDPADIATKVARLEELLAAKYKLTRGDLAVRAARLGRGVPPRVRRDIASVVEAAQVAGHPKLALQQDKAAIDAAFARAVAHLQAVDLKARRKDRLLSLTADIMAKLLVVIVLVLVVVIWRGPL